MKRFFLGAVFFLLLMASSASADTRIIGGHPASTKSWPYISAIVDKDSLNAYWGQWCGGSLISSRWVLTAAHCAEDIDPQTVDVVVGRKRLDRPGGKRVSIAAVYSHPGYTAVEDDWTTRYDFGLIYLAKPVYLPTAEIATTRPKTGAIGKAAGWGIANTDIPRALRAVSLPILPDSTCENALVFNDLQYFFSDSMMCAGSTKGKIDTCSGDSGGPLAVRGKLVGVVSWGLGCALPGYPGVYARLQAVLPWIESTMAHPPAEYTVSPIGKDHFFREPELEIGAGLADAYGTRVQAFSNSNYKIISTKVSFSPNRGKKGEFCLPEEQMVPARALPDLPGGDWNTIKLRKCFGPNHWFSLRPEFGYRSWYSDIIVVRKTVCPTAHYVIKTTKGIKRETVRAADYDCDPNQPQPLK